MKKNHKDGVVKRKKKRREKKLMVSMKDGNIKMKK